MRFEAILFDLDGTLLDTLTDLADACNRTLTARDYPTHNREAYRYFVGDGVEQLIRRILPPEARDEAIVNDCINAFKSDYAENWHVQTRPYAGIPELLTAAHDKGLRLAVLSNKPHKYTVQCVEQFLSEHSFEMVLGATSEFPHKPDPASALHIAKTMQLTPEQFLYLGDTATDMQTATSAGMYAVGALWGFRQYDELQQAGAQALLQEPLDMLGLL